MSERLEQLLQCLIHVVGRAAIPEERVREIVSTGEKQVEAFNLCDGTRTQKQIIEAVGLDSGNFSRAAARWVETGVAFTVGDGSDERLLHIFPIPETKKKREPQKKKQSKPRQR
jgi:hypothetical protein